MGKKLNYNPESLLNFKFSPALKGYNTDEVDKVFDKIISDYEAFIASYDELLAKCEKQDIKCAELKEQLDRVTFELANVKKERDILKKTSNINEDNYKLFTKVAAYERVLHRKGVDLKKALSDPDNC